MEEVLADITELERLKVITLTEAQALRAYAEAHGEEVEVYRETLKVHQVTDLLRGLIRVN